MWSILGVQPVACARRGPAHVVDQRHGLSQGGLRARGLGEEGRRFRVRRCRVVERAVPGPPGGDAGQPDDHLGILAAGHVQPRRRAEAGIDDGHRKALALRRCDRAAAPGEAIGGTVKGPQLGGLQRLPRELESAGRSVPGDRSGSFHRRSRDDGRAPRSGRPGGRKRPAALRPRRGRSRTDASRGRSPRAHSGLSPDGCGFSTRNKRRQARQAQKKAAPFEERGQFIGRKRPEGRDHIGPAGSKGKYEFTDCENSSLVDPVPAQP